MDSIVREVITRAGEEPRVPEGPTQGGFVSDDAELERILASLRTNVKIIGIGGGGTNTIDRLVEAGIIGAELYAANTDAQHLLTIRAPHKILLGRRVTRGLGAGALPQVGEEAAREAEEEIRAALQGADMVFLTCGLGGGTGTGGCDEVAGGVEPAGGPGVASPAGTVSPDSAGGNTLAAVTPTIVFIEGRVPASACSRLLSTA